MLEPELQSVVEQLCHEGCLQVTAYIQEIEAQHFPPSMQELPASDQQRILAELKSIMSVYET